MKNRRVDATGRSTDKQKNSKRASRLVGNWVPHTREMLESPAWMVMLRSSTAYKVLSRIELEHMRHAGQENGQLICTYADFEAYGVRRKSVPDALLYLERLGFIEVTVRGRGGNADYNTPNRYRLTFVLGNNIEPTNDWKRIKTIEEAERLVNQSAPQRARPSLVRSQPERRIA